jgi:rhamnose transport system ATP-binding protein
MAENALLQAVKVSKAYDGVQALIDADLTLKAGEVQALVGENGAGKSTLIKIITGAVQQDEGELFFNGEPVVNNSPALSKSLGIAAIYQQPALFPELTVAENIALGREAGNIFGLINGIIGGVRQVSYSDASVQRSIPKRWFPSSQCPSSS